MPNKKPLKVKDPFYIKLVNNRSKKEQREKSKPSGPVPQYKYKGGKIDDANYKSCGANIMRTK